MNEPKTVTPVANSTEAFQAAIVSYKQQHEAQTAQLRQLDINYHQQREQMTKTLDMLVGAVAAIEQIIKNVSDEAAAKAALVPMDTTAEPVAVEAVAEAPDAEPAPTTA